MVRDGGTICSQDVLTVHNQVVQVGEIRTRWRYGTVGYGHDLIERIWTGHEHVFSIQKHNV
jgi:hypothetical protein